MFRADAAREIFARARIDGFAFDVEIFHLAHCLGYKIQTIPVRWTDSPHSTVRALRHGAQMLRDLLRLRFSAK
jgi:dolichyl-phosphate beta-glucosyltransferase